MNAENPTFPVTLNLRIDWSELDIFGHVNNVMFFKYIQAARVNYWEKIGLLDSYHTELTGPMLVNCNCQFVLPLFFPGEIVVSSRMEFIRNSSFGLHHLISNSENQTVAEAHDVIVMFDYKQNKKTKFPEALRKKVESLEKKDF